MFCSSNFQTLCSATVVFALLWQACLFFLDMSTCCLLHYPSIFPFLTSVFPLFMSNFPWHLCWRPSILVLKWFHRLPWKSLCHWLIGNLWCAVQTISFNILLVSNIAFICSQYLLLEQHPIDKKLVVLHCHLTDEARVSSVKNKSSLQYLKLTKPVCVTDFTQPNVLMREGK